MEIQEIKQIAAFLPCYEKGRGQGIKLYYRNGETGFLHLAMRTFLAKTAGLFAVSLRESRKRYGLLLDRKNLVPLVLTPYLLYVPLKARIPAVPGDPAYGYFRLRSIIEINREPQPCTLLLEGGHNLTINQSYRGTRRHLQAARKLEDLLVSELFQIMDTCSDGKNSNLQFCPAYKKCHIPSR